MNKRVDNRQGRPIIMERAGVTVTRVGANLGAEISGVDLTRPLSDEAFRVIERIDLQSRDDLITLTEIPAPPFKEGPRARKFADLLTGAGVDSVWIDEVGNVLALRRGKGVWLSTFHHFCLKRVLEEVQPGVQVLDSAQLQQQGKA